MPDPAFGGGGGSDYFVYGCGLSPHGGSGGGGGECVGGDADRTRYAGTC